MGTVFKKTVTRSLPENATIKTKRRRATRVELRKNPHSATVVESVATWPDRTGKKRSGIVFESANGSKRVKTKSETYYAKYRDGDEIVRTVATGCRDKQAASAKLAELERTGEKIRAGVITTDDCRVAESLRTPLPEHLAVYRQSMQAAGTSERHIKDTMRLAGRIMSDCSFQLLRDVNGEAVESWLVTNQNSNMGARTRNSYLQAINGFLNWCVQSGRIHSNPLKRVKRADELIDTRRQRRALDESDLRRLLFVARWRPIAELGRKTERKTADELPENNQSRRTWRKAPLTWDTLESAIERGRQSMKSNPEYLATLDRRGWERSLIYKIAVLTGLRRGEIQSLTLGHLQLSGPMPCLNMQAQDTKNGEAVSIPIRGDVLDDLQLCLASKQQAVTGVVSLKMQAQLPETPLFDNVPRQLVKTLDRNIAVAGIAKRDDRGRVVDFHALRHSFGTMLSTSGVAPRTAQQAMRHSRIELTMGVYTAPRLLDVAGAFDMLPTLPIFGPKPTERERQKATGTDPINLSVAPMVAPAGCNGGQNVSTYDKETVCGHTSKTSEETKKAPRNTVFPGLSSSDADGTRTRNLRIDSPGL
jgi:integrase